MVIDIIRLSKATEVCHTFDFLGMARSWLGMVLCLYKVIFLWYNILHNLSHVIVCNHERKILNRLSQPVANNPRKYPQTKNVRSCKTSLEKCFKRKKKRNFTIISQSKTCKKESYKVIYHLWLYLSQKFLILKYLLQQIKKNL